MPRAKFTPADPADEPEDTGAAAKQAVRIVPAGSLPPPPTTAPASVFAAGLAAKPQRAPRVYLDVSSVQVKTGVPLPPAAVGVQAIYPDLWARMPVGSMVELNRRQAYGLVSHAKKVGGKVAVRTLGADVKGVWRLA